MSTLLLLHLVVYRRVFPGDQELPQKTGTICRHESVIENFTGRRCYRPSSRLALLVPYRPDPTRTSALRAEPEYYIVSCR